MLWGAAAPATALGAAGDPLHPHHHHRSFPLLPPTSSSLLHPPPASSPPPPRVESARPTLERGGGTEDVETMRWR